jgi:gas vesicle protein
MNTYNQSKGRMEKGRTTMMDYENSSENSGAIFAFLAGALIGAGAALLLAPQSGAKTRRWLSEYAEKAKDQLDSAIDTGKEYLQTGVDRGKEYLEGAQSTMQNAAQRGRDEINRQVKR